MDLKGKIVEGIRQARDVFGIKTANIETEAETDPGIYAGVLSLEGTDYQGVCFVGKAHLIEGKPQRVEISLFDYDGPDFYDKEVTLSLNKKIREVTEFKNFEEAKIAIASDIKAAKAFFEIE